MLIKRPERDLTDVTRRDSNLELLRIICNILIIGSHCVGWYLHVNTIVGTIDWQFANLVVGVARNSTACFMLISGYFYSKSKSNLKKILLPAAFYLFLYYLYMVFIDYSSSSLIKPLFELILDVFKNGKMLSHYWYIHSLILITLLAPFFKSAIDGMSKKAHMSVIGAFALFCSVFPSVNQMTGLTVFQAGLYSNGFLAFCLMYLIGAYINKYPPEQISLKTSAILAAAAYLLIPLLNTIWSSRISPLLLFNSELSYPFDTYVSPFSDTINIICALKATVIFVFFTKLRFSSRFIRNTASLTYGSYLCHMLYIYLANYLIARHPLNMPYIPYLLIRWLITITLTFSTEFLRQKAVSMIRKLTQHKAA